MSVEDFFGPLSGKELILLTILHFQSSVRFNPAMTMSAGSLEWMTTTMTMTHSSEVSTWCQPCPTDANGEVVTSVKKESVELVRICTSRRLCDQYLQNDRWTLTNLKMEYIWILEFVKNSTVRNVGPHVACVNSFHFPRPVNERFGLWILEFSQPIEAHIGPFIAPRLGQEEVEICRYNHDYLFICYVLLSRSVVVCPSGTGSGWYRQTHTPSTLVRPVDTSNRLWTPVVSQHGLTISNVFENSVCCTVSSLMLY